MTEVKEGSDTLHVAMLSGGRDSTAMVELLLSQGRRIDYIITSDTFHEFPQMYEYLEKFNKHIQEKYGMHITYLHPKKSFEDWVFGKITRGDRKGMIRGIPKVLFPCYWTREAKVMPVIRFIKSLGYKKEEVVEYIGYTYSEQKRSKVKAKNQIYPLIEAKMCEADVDTLLESINMVNPLYRHFARTGCYFCPKQSERSLFTLYKNYPEQFEYMLNIENKLKSMDNVVSDQWFIKHSLKKYKEIFDKNPKNLSEEAPKSCECVVQFTDTGEETIKIKKYK